MASENQWMNSPATTQRAGDSGPMDLNTVRERLEFGPGGDVEASGRLTRHHCIWVPGLKQTVSTWLRLYERVQRGELGGATDGLLDEAA
ncbi:MAG TPA: hypothetical protein VF818_00545 [Ktedonobacterales bacterium]